MQRRVERREFIELSTQDLFYLRYRLRGTEHTHTHTAMPMSLKRNEQTRRSIFVTVGTTKFDSLVSAVSDPKFLQLISRKECGGYNEVTVQYGRGDVVPFQESDVDATGKQNKTSEDSTKVVINDIKCSSYKFKPTLRQDMEGADLILSHAGAGSIMEGLELCYAANKSRSDKNIPQKKLVVVTNAALMHGHQSELADALSERGHLFVVNDPTELLKVETLQRIQEFEQVPFEGGDGGVDFAALVDEHFGFEP